MKKFMQRFFSKKRNVVFFIIFIAILGSITTYIFRGVVANLQEMNEEIEPVTYFPPYPMVNTEGKSPQEIEQIRQGEYLTKAGDCIACHTNSPEQGQAFAGGLPMQTPFGVIYSPNITPDKETGIGNWTDEQFIKAMREGISPHGKQYYPAFPYLYFNKITTTDLKAIRAYLNAIPSIHQENKENHMVWPFNFRFLQSGWRLLFFLPGKTGSYQYDTQQSDAWNRGKYLVDGLGHCAMCHTPSYYMLSKKIPLGAPIKKYDLTGSPIQGFLAPNISKMNLATVSDEELLKVFTHNQLVGGGMVEGPMLEANQNSLKYLTRSDMLAIITYIKSVESKTPPLPRGGIGKGLYENYCAGCHANGGGGAPVYGDAAAWNELLKKGKDTVYNNAIKGIDGMPAKGSCVSCSDNDIKQAVDYMLAAVKGKSGSVVPPPKKLTLEDGKMIYNKDCSSCHTNGFNNAPKLGDQNAWKPMVDAGFLATYNAIMSGKNGHLPHGACPQCSDAELIAAVKYMMTESSNNDYSLW